MLAIGLVAPIEAATLCSSDGLARNHHLLKSILLTADRSNVRRNWSRFVQTLRRERINGLSRCYQIITKLSRLGFRINVGRPGMLLSSAVSCMLRSGSINEALTSAEGVGDCL